MNREKKQCPCCGGRAELLCQRRNGFSFFSVECTECGLRTAEYPTYIEAIDKWNERNLMERKTIDNIISRLEDLKKHALDLVGAPEFIKKDLQELVDMCFDESIKVIREEVIKK